jgi:hypothetical protein
LWPEVFGAAEPCLPRAGGLWALVLDRVASAAPSDPLVPLYLRRPDARTLAERGLA